MIYLLLIIIILINFVLVWLVVRNKQASNSHDAVNTIEKKANDLDKSIKDEFSRFRNENSQNEKQLREEVQQSFKGHSDSMDKRMQEFSSSQGKSFETFSKQLDSLTEKTEQKLEVVKSSVEKKLTDIQKDNTEKLETMRATVDEKLHATLERRLGESFKIVSDRLDLVHKGLGEMQSLASGVGDLKKVLQNVKTRGIWGEIQLGNLLEQVLIPDQYKANVITKTGSNDRVEYVIVLPGQSDDNKKVLLPIDAKFPLEDYQRLVEAQEKADVTEIELHSKALEQRVRGEAKTIQEKYLDPPNTTDFGILYLATEGLYAEILRRPGLAESIQSKHRVIITGPTTIAALLNSLQMGFRTLAIQKRSSEVWKILTAVKTEFHKFGDVLEKTQKKLQEASSTIETAATRTRMIEQKLGKVQELPSSEASTLPLEEAIAPTISKE